MEGKKGIADYAFKECDTISDVTDTSNVEYIGRSAFYKSTLRSISLGSKITTIEDYAFYGCPLRTIDLPVNLTSIGRSAFYETQLARVNFSESNKLETVGAYAFFGAASLERVNFGDTVKEIGAYAFYGCSALDLSLPGSALPDSLEVIGSSAFRKCVNLKEVTFGNGLKEIGSSAFSDSGLISLHLPDGLEKVGSFAFCVAERSNVRQGAERNRSLRFCGRCGADGYHAARRAGNAGNRRVQVLHVALFGNDKLHGERHRAARVLLVRFPYDIHRRGRDGQTVD